MKKHLSNKKISIKLNGLCNQIANKTSTELFEEFYDKIELFVKGLLYKKMDKIFKFVLIESQKYELIYNLNNNIDIY